MEMRGQSPLKQETKEGVKLDRLSNNTLKEEPHLSGAYIRSLVKELATSRTEDSMNSKDQDCVVDGDSSPGGNLRKQGKVLGGQMGQQPRQPQQHKKQVRRRLHAGRPYQERLLNMAEARREIVTALKYHRAAMKQASEQQQLQQQQQLPQVQQQQQPVSLQPPLRPSCEQDGRIKSWRNPRTYSSSTADFSNYLDNFSYSALSHPCSTGLNPFCWPPAASPVAPPPLAENPNFILPNQPLGLNLNYHDFNNLYLNSKNTSLHSNPSPSSSSSTPLSVITDQEIPSVAISQGEGTSSALVDSIDSSRASQVTGGLHTAMDAEAVAELRSLGEQYQMEWNDTMNLVTSAWWFKFLDSMEFQGADEAKTEDDAYPVFDEVMELPVWLDANESCLELCSKDYFRDPTLPCMDIEDIESMDGEWLS